MTGITPPHYSQSKSFFLSSHDEEWKNCRNDPAVFCVKHLYCSYALTYGMEKDYPNPEIIEAILDYMKVGD